MLLFGVTVAVALSFADPLAGVRSPRRTAHLFLALAALFPSGAAAYLAGQGRFRGAMAMTVVVAVLYAGMATIAAPALTLPALAAVAAGLAVGWLISRSTGR